MHCHGASDSNLFEAGGRVALVGHPNVGKSVIFQRLTGQRVTVSNYPGTTVEVTRGMVKSLPETILVDTPGVIAFPPQTEDEQVTARVLLDEPLKAILQVGDAKNLRRTLQLTVQLAEMGLPMAVALNMMDEAETRGVVVDDAYLSRTLGLMFVPTTAVRGRGVNEVIQALSAAQPSEVRLLYAPEIESTIANLLPHLPAAPITARALALLWISGDSVTQQWITARINQGCLQTIETERQLLVQTLQKPVSQSILATRLAFVNDLVEHALLKSGAGWRSFSATLGTLTTHPIWGTGILLAVLYFLYWFVGIFGAGTLVGLLEENLFGEVLNPWFTALIEKWIPIRLISDFLVGEYGLWTMGMTYALALILPIVSTFFLAFGIMEDSGYLPRLSALSNKLFAALGLNGKAVLPMVLGLGCVTMATMTARVLESKRDRLLVTLLLALAIPCSAQLGVVMGMLAGISFAATSIWAGVVFLVLLVIGWLAAKVIPGERTLFLSEMPPLRLPILSNVIMKTLARLEWYLKEVVPLFLIGTALLFILDKITVLDFLTRWGEPLVSGWLGLPAETSSAFLIGFLRRDFGATGLFMMESNGLLSPLQVVVSMVTITLFIPCVASVMVIAKERGWKVATGMVVFILPLAFFIGGLLYRALAFIGWNG